MGLQLTSSPAAGSSNYGSPITDASPTLASGYLTFPLVFTAHSDDGFPLGSTPWVDLTLPKDDPSGKAPWVSGYVLTDTGWLNLEVMAVGGNPLLSPDGKTMTFQTRVANTGMTSFISNKGYDAYLASQTHVYPYDSFDDMCLWMFKIGLYFMQAGSPVLGQKLAPVRAALP